MNGKQQWEMNILLKRMRKLVMIKMNMKRLKDPYDGIDYAKYQFYFLTEYLVQVLNDLVKWKYS